MKKNEELSKKKGNLFGGFIKNKSNFLKEKLSKAFYKKPKNIELKAKEEIKESEKKEEPNFKVYNIQISEEENHVYEINEEEEEEYETIHEENNKIMEEKKENEKKINNNKKNLEEEINIKKMNDNENIIKEDDIPKKILEEKNSIEHYCHYMFLKGSLISKNEIQFYQFSQLKKKNILTRLVFVKKKENNTNENQFIQIPYICFFDENFIYFLEDKEINKKEPNLRIVGNYYNIFKIIDFKYDEIENNNKLKIILTFLTDGKKIIKELIFEKEKGTEFINNINIIFKKFNIKLSQQ